MTTGTGTTQAEIQRWLVERVCTYLEVAPAELDVDAPFADLGLDSVYGLSLSGDVEDAFGVEVDAALVWDYPTIRELSGGIVQLINGPAS